MRLIADDAECGDDTARAELDLARRIRIKVPNDGRAKLFIGADGPSIVQPVVSVLAPRTSEHKSCDAI